MIPNEVREAARFVSGYAASSNDWIVVKKEILKNLRPEFRKLFGLRDPITKKQRINDFDIQVAALWKSITGVGLILTQDGTSTKID